VVLAVAPVSVRSVALAGFGPDSLIGIGASAVVIGELSGTGEDRVVGQPEERLVGVSGREPGHHESGSLGRSRTQHSPGSGARTACTPVISRPLR
jgi:hypothetical protein